MPISIPIRCRHHFGIVIDIRSEWLIDIVGMRTHRTPGSATINT
jgi:hypothetical protein